PGAGLPDALLARKRTGVVERGDLPADLVTEVAGATSADLIVWAKPAEGAFGRRIEVAMIAAGPSLGLPRERLTLSLEDDTQTKDFVSRLDAATALVGPWIGLETVEVRRAPNPIIIRVPPSGPAAKSGARPGDAVVSLGGKGVSSPRDLAS